MANTMQLLVWEVLDKMNKQRSKAEKIQTLPGIKDTFTLIGFKAFS